MDAKEKALEMRAERHKLWEEMMDITEKSTPATWPEKEGRWKELDQRCKAMLSQIEALERNAVLGEEMREVKVPPPSPINNDPENRGSLTDFEAATKRYQEKLDSKEYRSAWMDYVRNGITDCRRESRNMLEDTLRESRTYTGLNTGTGAQGGFVVPIAFQRELEKKMRAYGRMRENCRILNTATGNTLDWPTYNDVDNEGEFLGESQPVSQQNPSFGQIQFNSFLCSSKQVLISVQLLQDSAFDLEGELSESFAIRLGRILNRKYTLGNGSGEPTGLVYSIQNDVSPNVVQAVGSSSNDGITANDGANSVGSDDLDNLISALDPAYRPNAKYMMNWRTIDQLRKLKDKYGRPLWVASLAVGEPDRIYGYPFDWNANMDVVAAGKYPILFGDFQKYVVRDVGGVTLVRYNELYMPNHQIGFQAFLRTDGKRLQPAAFALLYNPLS